MLYVIETALDGRVTDSWPCPNGIADAIDWVALRLTHPEEDWEAACDVLTDVWNRAIQKYGQDAYSNVVFTRKGLTSRYGLLRSYLSM